MLIKNQKINLITLGCRVNSCESSAIAHDLKMHGALIVNDLEKATICIINTCCVTSKADAKSRYFINRASRMKNIKLIIVVGCYSQLNNIDNDKVGIILGAKYKNDLITFIKQYHQEKIIKIDKFSKLDKFDEYSDSILFSNTRAFLKIQDGCDYMCSYCLIPFARGRQRSLNHNKVISLIKNAVNQGYKEIVLSGVNVAGYNDGKYNFFQLLKAINQLSGSFRVRISSMEPFQIDTSIIDLITSNPSRWCQHLHLCIQNANDQIIKDMNRKYTIKQFNELCKYARKHNPKISLTTDYIVGFPTETESCFKNSLINLKKIKFCDIHIFPYSQRKNTLASKLKNLVSDYAKHKRFHVIQSLNESNKINYLKRFIDQRVNILFEKSNEENIQVGHSEYFFKVKVSTSENLTNKLLKVTIKKIEGNQLFGELNF